MHIRRDRTIYGLTMTAAFTAAMALLAPWTVPLGPVPLSACTLMVYLSAWLLTPGRAVTAVTIYVLLGAAGLPVFSGFLGGVGRLAGPTGGYILGYLPLCMICVLFIGRFRDRRWLCLLGMVLGTAVLYAVGTAWFCVQTETTVGAALVVCVLPFIAGDAVKIGAALLLGPVLRDRLKRTGLLFL